MIRRRTAIVALGASALLAPLSALSQQRDTVWRIGVLSAIKRPERIDSNDSFRAFLLAMRELGYVEGKNLTIEWRFADNDAKRLPALAAELVSLRPNVIVAHSTPATEAVQKATATLPIVMVNIADPVGSGFAKTLARPGGNITGTASITRELSAKHLEMLLSIAPKLTRVAVLINPNNQANAGYLQGVQAVAPKTGVTILATEARSLQEIEAAFKKMATQNVQGVIVAPDPFFGQQGRRLAELTRHHRLPSIYAFAQYAEVGGLMSYGSRIPDQHRRAATYVDKILKGANPAELPVEQPMTFELVVNGKTAQGLGLVIPPSLRISADRVIE